MNKETPRTRIRFGFEKTQTEKLQCEIDTDLFQGQPVLKFALHAHRQAVKTEETKVGCLNLLPAETNIFNVKAVVAVVVEILSVHCGIPHHLHKRKSCEQDWSTW